MLQRAASNAYSWWWVSHIRTKQSKWMEQNLQDMEEKVQNVIKLIEEDGDSFAKRAEMYYKKRPELINFVEESYKAYRALAERYDHISTELQNANNTIASVFPERVPFMDEDDEEATPRPPRKLPEGFKTNIPKPPLRDLKSVVKAATAATKKFNSKKTATAANTATANSKVPKSGLSRKEALEEVGKLQKQILALQTVKEFVKSSYDNAIARYWETEEQIKELQERVSILQDELGEGIVIEDNEARRLMAEAALKSCEEKLSKLQERQERSLDETKVESKRINDVKAKLGSLMDEFEFDQRDSKEPGAKRDVKIVSETIDLENDMGRLTQHRKDLQLLQENIKEKFEAGSNSSLAAAEMAEKIDELVNKVISLENAVSSQTALVDRLKTETDELQDHIRTLEGDKESLIQDKNKLNDKLREMEQKLFAVQDLNQIVEDQNNNLQIHFTESRCTLNHLSEEVQNVLQGEEVLIEDSSHMQKNSSDQAESKYEPEGPVPLNQDSVLPNNVKSAKEEDNGLLVDAVNSDKEINISSSAEDNVTSDNKFEVVGSTQNGVHTDNELEINGTLEMKEATSMENKPPKELKEQEKTLNPCNSDGKDTAVVNTITTTENQDVSQHRKSNEADHSSTESFQNTLRDDLQLEVAGSTQNGVHTDNDLMTNGTLEMKEATPMESKDPKELTEQEKTLNPGNSDGKATVVVNTIITTENREISQHPKSNEADHNSPEGFENTLDSKEHATAQEDEPDWREMFMNGMQDREKALLTEYTNTLRNYKELKKKLAEIETKNQDNPFDPSLQLQLNELKTSNTLKDEEIRLLHQKLGLLQITLEGNEDFADSTSAPPQEESDIEKLLKIELPASTSAIEEKFRSNMDVILEENLTFWLTFSTTYAEIQRFETTIKDLEAEVSKLEVKGKSSEASGSIEHSLKSDAKPIYKHLTEIETEITVWLEKSSQLKEELERRFSSLCDIQEEITNALKASAEDDDFRFTSYQAAKFQGEVLNMKQENNKVADELQAGLDIVTSLQVEVEKALVKLNEQFGLSTSKRLQNGQLRQSETRARVPLRSFIFGAKPKKQSIFSCMTPGMHRKLKSNKEQGHM